MFITVLLALVAGFFAGNGLPYYVQGSLGEGRNPSPFPDRPYVNVLVGLLAFIIAGTAWSFANVQAHPAPAWLSAAAGLLVVALIHTRTWRDENPWGKRTARS
ncbi:hypothetical protein [Dactylosporangium sp. NPDC051541]|uniref:hypothetical protein n=1 Tax=Dactylosporangium sp. NPDC051541 TaxID=3363977 RepID=UPI0037AA7073